MTSLKFCTFTMHHSSGVWLMVWRKGIIWSYSRLGGVLRREHMDIWE